MLGVFIINVMKNVSIFLFLFSYSVQAQSYEYQNSIGNFTDASSFFITANGNIYVTDSDKNEIILLDTLGNEIKSIGGYGWDENSFDDPEDVYADPLTVYVADKNNHSIKRFDKNLNFISFLNKKESNYSEEQFGYPLSCATSNQGDLYFIDSENKRVMKFDIFGNFINSFGGLDAGKYQLKNPAQLAINSFNNIFVADNNSIFIFDHYGNGISKIDFDKELNSIRIIFDQLVVTTENEIYETSLKSKENKLTRVSLSGYDISKIISAIKNKPTTFIP